MIAPAASPPDSATITALIFDRGASFPWRTDDPRLTANGVIGEAQGATPELGQAIIDSVVEETRGVLRRLLDSQRPMPGASPAWPIWKAMNFPSSLTTPLDAL